MPTLTATVLPAIAGVRLDVDFTDTDSPYVYITRTNNVTGVVTPVRLHGQTTTVGGLAYANLYAGYQGVFYDLEAPLDTPVSYTASSVLSTMNLNTTFESASLVPWTVNAAAVLPLFTLSTPGLTGTYSAALVGDGATATPTVFSERIPATVGSTWTITANTESNVNFVLGLRWLTSAGAQISLAGTTANTGLTAPVSVTYSFVAPATTAFVQGYVQVSGTPAGGSGVIFDDVTVTVPAATATSATVTVQSLSQSYLKDPQNPANNVGVLFCFDPQPNCTPTEGIFFQSMDTETWAANSAAFGINNQPSAMVVSKQRQNPSSTLILVTRQFVDRDRLLALLSPGTPLLFQVPPEYGIPDLSMSVGAVSVQRPLPDHRYPIRIVSLPWVSAVMPSGPMGGALGARWQDGCHKFATWAAISAASVTWQQALQGALY